MLAKAGCGDTGMTQAVNGTQIRRRVSGCVAALLVVAAVSFSFQPIRELMREAAPADGALHAQPEKAPLHSPADAQTNRNLQQSPSSHAASDNRTTTSEAVANVLVPEAANNRAARESEGGASTGENVNEADSITSSPLNRAVIEGDIDVVRFLLANGIDVNARSTTGFFGETPLHSVAYAGHTQIARLLLAYGADVNATDQYRYTPLRRTVEQGHVGMTELLINKGADIVTRDTNGLTLLHVVARTDHVEIARLLITGGVDMNAMDRSGFTPLDYAQGGEIRMAEILERLGAICTVC